MRVCLISSEFAADGPTGNGGGIETYVRLMAKGLAMRGHDVHVITPSTQGRRSFAQDGVHVHTIHIPDDWHGNAPELGEARSALSFAWHARRMVRFLISTVGPFDIVEVPEYKGQGFFLTDEPDVRLVVKCHAHLLSCLTLNGIELSLGTALIADLERETLHKANAIHSNSGALAALCATDYGIAPQRLTYIPYGIDTTVFRPASATPLRKRLGLEDARIVLFVGRMEERKGVSTLVPAFAEVAACVPDAVLLLVGPDVVEPSEPDGTAARMSREWERLGVASDRFLFLGTVANDLLPSIYSTADVMVAPSPFEAFGLVYLEAMACGCPAVGCRGSGAAEIFSDEEVGVLVPPHDAAALAQSLTCLLTEPSRRAAMSARGRALVRREYSADTMVNRTVRFYEEAVA